MAPQTTRRVVFVEHNVMKNDYQGGRHPSVNAHRFSLFLSLISNIIHLHTFYESKKQFNMQEKNLV